MVEDDGIEPPTPCFVAGLSPAELILRSGDPYGIRTRVTAVKGRCLNHLTNGPICMAEKKDSNPRTALAIYSLSREPLATWVLLCMAPQVGLEPTTDRLTADSSTTELLRNNEDNLYLIKILSVSQEVFNNILFKRDMFIIYWIAFLLSRCFRYRFEFPFTLSTDISFYIYLTPSYILK